MRLIVTIDELTPWWLHSLGQEDGSLPVSRQELDYVIIRSGVIEDLSDSGLGAIDMYALSIIRACLVPGIHNYI